MTVLAIVIGCNNDANKDAQNNKSNSLGTSSVKQDSLSINPDCQNTVKDFLAWYKMHFDSLKAIQLVDLIEEGSIAQYRVNFKNAAKYIDQLRSSGFFSEKYCQSKLQYFKEKDQELVKDKQSDGPPVGFEADLLLYTQEPREVLKKYRLLKIDQINPTVFKLISVDNNLLFNLETQSGKCIIDEIIFAKK
jgi:hypothetical protein